MARLPGSHDREPDVHSGGTGAGPDPAEDPARSGAPDEPEPARPREVLFRYRLLPEPRCEYLSSSVKGLTGYAPDEFFADPFLAYAIIHPDDLPLLLQLGLDCRKRGRVLRWVRKDGTVVWTEHCYVPIRSAEGEVVAIEGLARDVSDRMASPPPAPSSGLLKPVAPRRPPPQPLPSRKPPRR